MSTQRRTWRAKFRDSFRGIREGLRGQSSFLVHAIASLLVIIVAAVLRVSRLEWALLVLCIALVVVSELLNTSIEWLAQVVSPQHDVRIGKALDIASAAVLLSALAACIVGTIVLLPHLLELLGVDLTAWSFGSLVLFVPYVLQSFGSFEG